ncbi:uncharacterized protein LOC113295012 [Papaver somniferum]|uniref:uncharacterized protein LOC113295012 n=1 Tax=Papaver somniferum TaxID=3469 RepID=UPI000E6F7A0D|nr:uncharacterized protein LOC113295012 [Papaver somniferum]
MHENICTAYKASKGKSRMFKDLWLLAITVTRSELWLTRNDFTYNNKKVSWSFFQKRVFNRVHEYSVRLKGNMWNLVEDLKVLDFFRVLRRRVKVMEPVECFWVPPEHNEIMICCDGASRGNPGRAGAGAVVRDSNSNVLRAMSVGFGIQTKYLAELFCVIVRLEWDVKFGVEDACIKTDSMRAILAYSRDINEVPWFLRSRWVAARSRYNNVRFFHTYREVNFAADTTAKRGCLLNNEEGISYENKPDFLRSIELPNVSYFRFNYFVSFFEVLCLSFLSN